VVNSFQPLKPHGFNRNLAIKELKENVRFPFKCPVCGVKHRSLESLTVKRCIKQLYEQYPAFEWKGDLTFELLWEASRRGITDIPDPPQYHKCFWEDWMIAVDQKRLRELYREFLNECHKEVARLKKEWARRLKILSDKILNVKPKDNPSVYITRGRFNEIKRIEINGVWIPRTYLTFKAVGKAGLQKPYADVDEYGRGEALNYDLYAVDPSRNLVVIQQRRYRKLCKKWFPNIRKRYYIVNLTDGSFKEVPPRLRKEIKKLSTEERVNGRIASLLESLTVFG